MATIKFGSLLIKTISKPFATALKRNAQEHPRFRKFCIDIAQTFHSLEYTLKMRILNYDKGILKPLSESRAIEYGANFLSEFTLFSVAALTIGGEIYYSTYQANKKKQKTQDRISELEKTIEIHINMEKEMLEEISKMKQNIQELNVRYDKTDAIMKELSQKPILKTRSWSIFS